MNCVISDTEWTDYLDQTLSTRERQKIDAHLRICAPCRTELDILRRVDQRLRIECGLIRQSTHVSDESRERVLAALRDTAPTGTHERLWRVRWVLALLCGSNTSARIIQAAESHAGVPSNVRPSEQKWQSFLGRLSFLTTEICGSYAGELIMAVGQ